MGARLQRILGWLKIGSRSANMIFEDPPKEMDSERLKHIHIAMQVEGMTSEGGLTIMDIFLRRSLATSPHGLCFEFGAHKGRTAALILQNLKEESWLHTVEYMDILDSKRLEQLSTRFTWHQEESENFCKTKLGQVVGDRQVAFSHHDANHSFDNVKTELEEIVKYSSADSVIVLDDFNDYYSQVRAAYYYLRYMDRLPFELLLIGFNKAVLVHQDTFDRMEEYVLNGLLDDLELCGFVCKLVRTDINNLSRSFLVAPRASTEPKLYGVDFFGDRFYRPSRKYVQETRA